ncbi:PSD1 and planctomycete cytochrome C domain-containing protein [Thalassoglobus polymorphus]|uniref:Planctomycete cytochrome C n=1 Tax=Thalassoglobus polymorphus TaxID=2527994 RepID=A0A517QUC1_9PLAN|nr:PSD1 and planctomycete cytochrome C domain-containing protein [Thalassoglobus polymorphus]QDT35246.1 Planctomycete cytochrome C [Thalassoglobus polymorphus]
MPTLRSFIILPAFALLCLLQCPVVANDQEQFFESHVRPLLAKHCFECHGEKKQQGELRLDRKQFVFEDGASGKAVVPGKLDESRLWAVVQFDEFDTQMPPTGKLPEKDLLILKKWIESGAYWPEEAHAEVVAQNAVPLKSDGSIDFEAAIANHWAYQPVQAPQVPERSPAADYDSAIDRYLAIKLNEKGLKFSERASKQTLIRRLSFDLRGLPPTIAEVQAFEADQSKTAYRDLIDRYLSESTYGQRWGRYWLDIARYADTKGYVFTENRFYPYAYTYRDYVIDAFNNDKPYDTFVMEQLAADQLGYAENDPRLAALGFVTVGPRFLNRKPDIIDDRIDVVTRGFMGMTLGCSRCHDHKFDPLPTADYYSLYGVFDSSQEPDLPPLRGELDVNAPGYQEFVTELNKREEALEAYKKTAHEELLVQARNHLDDYFPDAIKSMGLLPADLELTPKHGALRDRLKSHWKKTLERMAKENRPFFLPATKLLALDDKELTEQLPSLLDELDTNDAIPDSLIEALRSAKITSKIEVVNVYTQVLSSVRDEWNEFKKSNPEATQFDDPGKEQARRILLGKGSLSDLDPGDFSPLFERDNRTKIRNLEKKIDEWHATSPNAPARSMVLFDKEKLTNPVIFVRGNVGRRGDRVPRRGPQILNPSPEAVFTKTSGRKELAEQIASKQNPLTARVLVNRIWMYHFGSPLVDTTSDFGLRTQSPTHRELLDYLAWSLMHEHNWSIKGLHREILRSQAWQQQSVDRPQARMVDSENQLYWKQNRQRLDFEAMRDTMLKIAGKIDLSLEGRPVDIEKQPFPTRRTVYALIDRNNPSGLLRTFDFPSPNSSSPSRSETTVPQQALFGMNSPFAQQMAKALAERVEKSSADPKAQVRQLIELAYSRPASKEEVELLAGYLKTGSLDELSQGLMLSNEFHFVD